MSNLVRETDKKSKTIKFERVVEKQKFKELTQKRKRFIVPMTVFFLLFYFSLPILTSFTDVLTNPAVGDINWAWVLAFLQFIMTWTLVTLYMKKSASFDQITDEILKEEVTKGGDNK